MAASSLFRRVSSHLPALPRPFLPTLSLETPLAAATFGPSSPAPCLPHLPSDTSMDLMAVPKKKVSRHKKGLRNRPKALKPVPVIIRCNRWIILMVVHVCIQKLADAQMWVIGPKVITKQISVKTC